MTAFYQARGWHPFKGEVYAEQPEGRIRFEAMAPYVFDFTPRAARRRHRPMRPAVVTPARPWVAMPRPLDNMSSIMYCNLD